MSFLFSFYLTRIFKPFHFLIIFWPKFYFEESFPMGRFLPLPPFIPKKTWLSFNEHLGEVIGKGPMATLGIITRPCFEVALASLKLEELVTRSCVPCSPRLCGSAYPFLSNTHKPHNQDSIFPFIPTLSLLDL